MNKQSATNASTRRVERVLCEEYLPNHPEASVTVYQYNSGSIRVRIIDPSFREKSIIARETEVLPIIRKLPDRIQDQVTMLLLLTPDESEKSMLSAEFNDPTPSRL